MTAILVDGVVFGLQLALLAVGLTMVFGLGGVLNLAHGQFVALAAIVTAVVLRTGVPVALAVATGIGVVTSLAVVVDRTLMVPVYRRQGEARVLLGLLLTLGLALVVDGILVTRFPFTALHLSAEGLAGTYLGVRMTGGSVLSSLVATTAILLLLLLLHGTRHGRAVRAVAQDEVGARLCGIGVANVRTVVFALSAVTAGLVAVTRALVSSVGATVGLQMTILALIVTVVGGLGRVGGALVAGLLLGIVYVTASVLVGTFVAYVVLLVTAMAVIVVRPTRITGASR